MKKYFATLFIFAIILFGFFTPTNIIHAQSVCNPIYGFDLAACFANAMGDLFASVAYFILTFVAYFLWLAGIFLDNVLKFTIIDLRENIAGLIGINIAWKMIKDLMNIVFIFMLVYQGIMLILGLDNTDSIKRFIIGIVMSAVLINFSLFFTKVLIDVSNVVSIGFYKSIITSSAPISLPATPVGGPSFITVQGISAPFMTNLGLSSFWKVDSISQMRNANGGSNSALILLPVMGIILFAIVTFVFFSIGVVFAVRFVVLLILLVLSPIAYMGLALSGMKRFANQWWNALNSQLIFAPIYMIMTWVVLSLMGTSGFITNSADWSTLVNAGGAAGAASSATATSGVFNLLFNFFIIIALALMSLFISKSVSSSGSGYIGKMTGQATATAGALAFGGSAWAGRKSFGLIGNRVADSASLQESASKERSGMFDRSVGALSRATLYTARTARDATFDARNASVPTSMIGDVTRGTLGRTKFGKAIGADKFETDNIEVNSRISDATGFGRGGTVGYKEETAKRDAKYKKIDEDNKKELLEAKKKITTEETKETIKAGIEAVQSAEYKKIKDAIDNKEDVSEEDMKKYEEMNAKFEAMQVAVAKQTDKQIEEIVAGNKELLKSQQFANSISVRQLDAVLKSEKISEEDRATFKNSRFSSISDVNLVDDDEYKRIKNAIDNNEDVSKEDKKKYNEMDRRIKAATGKIKGYSETEIKMLDNEYLTNKNVVAAFRSQQFEQIAKNEGFTASQRKIVKDFRMEPLLNSLDSTKPNYIKDQKAREKVLNDMISRGGLNAKDLAGLASTKIKDPNNPDAEGSSLILNKEIIRRLDSNQVKKMVEEMNPSDVEDFTNAIENQILEYEVMKKAFPGPNSVNKKFEKFIKWAKSKDNTLFNMPEDEKSKDK